ncbi:MAG: hypothetical protein EOO40_03600 [Deltaproteobacteria bacterium]|nr:MAG: hypothetical protein EOO40_03600 [Deltaproteobacteria bacterium]
MALGKLTALRRLEYRGNSLDEATMRSLGSLSNLREVSLDASDLEQRHLPFLLALTRLQRLDLPCYMLGAAAQAQLQASFGTALLLDEAEWEAGGAIEPLRVASIWATLPQLLA